MRNARSLFVALSLVTLVACAESSPVLPPGVGPDYDIPDELKDDDGDGDGNGQGNGSGKNNPTAASCDDPSTCEYDLETTCGGQPVIDPASDPRPRRRSPGSRPALEKILRLREESDERGASVLVARHPGAGGG